MHRSGYSLPIRVFFQLCLAAGLLGCARPLPGQSEEHARVDEQMGGVITDGPHLTLTSMRPASAADSARAAAIADTLRRAISQFADVHNAEAAGFRPFAPGIKNQPVLHYTRWRSAVRAAFEFDPSMPTSLLYRREPDGSLRLIGRCIRLHSGRRWTTSTDGCPCPSPAGTSTPTSAFRDWASGIGGGKLAMDGRYSARQVRLQPRRRVTRWAAGSCQSCSAGWCT